jgi:hypothetical protein
MYKMSQAFVFAQKRLRQISGKQERIKEADRNRLND